TRVADRHLVGVRLQADHQLLEILRRRGRAGDEQLMIAWQHRYRLEILHQVVLQRIDRAVDDVRAQISEYDPVAVGCRARDPGGGDAAPRAGAGLEYGRWSER